MLDLLRRAHAPLTTDAWKEVDDTTADVLKSQLSARKLVDFCGPHGVELGAANLGRLDIADEEAPGGVAWGMRRVQPLVEVRIPFVLSQMELDNISRGSKDADLAPAEEAARKLVAFEESAIYNGFKPGQIAGLTKSAEHKPLKLPSDAAKVAQTVGEGEKILRQSGIGGPYALVLGTEYFYPLMEAGRSGYPPARIIRDILCGEIWWSPALDGGVLLSTRGGDFELVVGVDISIGYAMHDRDNVELYLTESFTFRVLEPAAVIELRVSK